MTKMAGILGVVLGVVLVEGLVGVVGVGVVGVMYCTEIVLYRDCFVPPSVLFHIDVVILLHLPRLAMEAHRGGGQGPSRRSRLAQVDAGQSMPWKRLEWIL